MQQVVDLQNSMDFQALGVELLSISPDSVQTWAAKDSELHIQTPTLSDVGNRMATAYGVMRRHELSRFKKIENSRKFLSDFRLRRHFISELK